MSYYDEISVQLAALGGTATPQQVRQALSEFDVRDIQAVRVSEGGGNGGSQTLEHVVVAIAFDTPGLVIPATGPAGILLTDLNPGDVAVAFGDNGFASVTTAWNGTTPKFNICLEEDRGNLPGTPPTPEATVTAINVDQDVTPASSGTLFGMTPISMWDTAICAVATGLYVYVDDGAGGDPASSQGEGAIHLFILRAP